VVWFVFDQLTAHLHRGYDINEIDSYQRAFPDQPVFLVTHADLPANLPPERFTHAGDVSSKITMWEESTSERPDEATVVGGDLVLWRLIPANRQSNQIAS
jgi:hypothetical protein